MTRFVPRCFGVLKSRKRLCILVLGMISILPCLPSNSPTVRSEEPSSQELYADPSQVSWDVGKNAFRVVESSRDVLVTSSGEIQAEVPPVASRILSPTSRVYEATDRSFTVVIDPWQSRALIAPGSRADLAGLSLADCRVVTLEANPRSVAIAANNKQFAVICDPPGFQDRGFWLVESKTGNAVRKAIPGSSNLHGVALDPSGTFALVVHLLHKSRLPSTQIDQGWVFTNVVSWVPLTINEEVKGNNGGEEKSENNDRNDKVVTFPLDLRTKGFANPEAVVIDADSRWAYVAHGGADVVSQLDLNIMRNYRTQILKLAEGDLPGYARGEDLRITTRIVRQRISVGAQPCSLALSPDGETLAVANRLSDSISLISTKSHTVRKTVELSDLQPTLARQGEKLFHSGSLAFGAQFSCASCHPDGHTDGLNWDLPADGFNNFHNTKSLLAVAGTEPYGWLGETPTLTERFIGTLRQLFQYEPSDDETRALEAYLQQLQYPKGLPARVAANDPAVTRGGESFRGKAGCATCHQGLELTDHEPHDVGTSSEPLIAYDTPSLRKIAETAPYLHDGRAATLEDIFTQHNPRKQHGNAANLTEGELADLIAFLRSL